MDFPIPKPRGIEKDIKVFPWDSLEAGLKKVMEKYVRSSLLRSCTLPVSMVITGLVFSLGAVVVGVHHTS